MTHAGSSASFLRPLKETLTAFAFDLGGLLAGFLVAWQLGVFRLSPWAIALYPAVISAQAVIQGLLSGRLSTALHLGTIYPRFSGNTKSFYKLVEAVIVLTLVTIVAMGAISLVFGNFFWGVTFADFPVIIGVMVATMALGLSLVGVTIKVAFISFKKGLDPDIMVYPVMSTVATIFITICFIVTLNVYFFYSGIGEIAITLLGVAHLLLILYILPRSLRDSEFTRTIRESLAALLIVALVVNVTGTILRGISQQVGTRREFFIVYPAIIGLISSVGSVIGSTATTKLALGMLKPRLSSLGNHLGSVLSAWLASVLMFLVLAVSAFLIRGVYTPTYIYNLVTVLLVANVIAVFLITLLSFSISILTFQKGLDPGNFVIPVENAFSASITSVALLAALVLLNLG